VTHQEISAFLRSHPRFLAENPELYASLAPPERVFGGDVADHMAAMLRAERAKAQGILAAGRAVAGMTSRVQEAVLALIRAGSVVDCIEAEFPALLGIDAASLCLEGHGERPLPAGLVARLLQGRAVMLREGSADALLHGAAARLARHEALILVPGDAPPALLVLTSRDDGRLNAGAGMLAFLGRAVATALGR
jgi:uncharacterized protein YigA (DUF484 family)